MKETISEDQLSHLLASGGVRVVDIRPMAAYNGWRQPGDTRGGHIPGAVSFPAAWARNMDDAQLTERLAAKHVERDNAVVVYGKDTADGAAFAARIARLGFTNVAALDGGFAPWSAADRFDVDRLPKYGQLVHPDWLADLLEGKPVEAAPQGQTAVLHVTYAGTEEYLDGHIPGAYRVDTNTLESPTDRNRRSPGELEAALLALGITNATTVIVYGRGTTAGGAQQHRRAFGQMAAARAAAILLYAGVEDVRLLDGGYEAWVEAGHANESGERLPVPATTFGTVIPARPDFFVDLAGAKSLLADPNGVLVSIRSWAEHVGEVSGYEYISQTGDIPGAVWGNSGVDAHDMQHYRNLDNTMRDFTEIAANWREAGITPDKQVAFYCGTGWRASETLFYAHLMGWPRVAVYDGGWFEWSAQIPELD